MAHAARRAGREVCMMAHMAAPSMDERLRERCCWSSLAAAAVLAAHESWWSRADAEAEAAPRRAMKAEEPVELSSVGS